MTANKCHYSAVDVPCVVRTPTREDCRACLLSAIETPTERLENCHLCGLRQPVKVMATDFNGNKYCGDRTSCWQRWDERHGLTPADPLKLAAMIPSGEGELYDTK